MQSDKHIIVILFDIHVTITDSLVILAPPRGVLMVCVVYFASVCRCFIIVIAEICCTKTVLYNRAMNYVSQHKVLLSPPHLYYYLVIHFFKPYYGP